MNAYLSFTEIKPETNVEELKANFMISDIAGILQLIGKSATIVCITSLDDDQKNKEFVYKQIAELLKDSKDLVTGNQYVICATAYISTTEFPKSEWYISKKGANDSGKKLIPIKEVLNRESILLEEAGFININDYVGYENKEAYLYNNDIGKEIIDYINFKL